MRVLIIYAILCLSSFIQAQDYKNEVKVGVPGAYFFDKSPFRFHDISDVPLLTFIGFTRKISNLIYLECNYSYLWIAGESGDNYFGRIYKREFHRFFTNANYSIIKMNNTKVNISSGAGARFKGGELFHVKYNYINGIPWEEILDFRDYNDFGLSIGTEIKYNFFKRFNVGFEIEYTKYFTDVSPNQLSTAIFLGYEF